MESEQIVNIKQWLLEKKAEQTAFECFWESFNNYKNGQSQEFSDVFGEFELEKLVVDIQSVAITFANYPDFNYNHIVINIPIRYKGRTIGLYRLLLNFDGVPDDDYFIID